MILPEALRVNWKKGVADVKTQRSLEWQENFAKGLKRKLKKETKTKKKENTRVHLNGIIILLEVLRVIWEQEVADVLTRVNWEKKLEMLQHTNH